MLFFVCQFLHAQPLEQTEGLKRFNSSAQLFDPQNRSLALTSSLDIKDVKTGQNVLAKAIELKNRGGEVHNITGGNRSDKVSFSFFQPIEESTLEQRIDLNFDKNSGFIESINLRYLLTSAYLSIELIRAQVLESAIAKYGEPLTLQQVQSASGQNKSQVKIADYIASLNNVPLEAQAYFKKMAVTRNAKISADKQGYALFHSGFDQCYIWSKNNLDEILSFCAFAPGAANANNRGLEFSLVNFQISKVIAEHKVSPAEQLKLTL